jgi:hypothetical protein
MQKEITISVPIGLFQAMTDVAQETGLSVERLAATAFQRSISFVLQYESTRSRFKELEERYLRPTR